MSEALSLRYRIATRTRLMRAILVVAALLALFSAVLFQAPELVGRPKILTDFDAFHIAGTMAAQGHAAQSYDTAAMLKAQQTISGTPSFMPWTYPPPYTLVVDALSRLPIGLAYLVFIAGSFAAYLHILRRIAGDFLPGVILAIVPTIILIVRTGQNGFLTGALAGWFVLLFLDRKNAGLPLGLMVIKPHLAGGIALLSLLERRWASMALAAASILAATAAPTIVYGPEIWTAFFEGARAAGQFLADGHYMLYRMSSVYAFARSIDLPAAPSFAVHSMVALLAIAVVIQAWRRSEEPRMIAAKACTTSLFLSPYNYDYDLAILGVAIALVIKPVLDRTSHAQQFALAVLCWISTGYGIAAQTALEKGNSTGAIAEGPSLAALTAPALVLLCLLTFLWLRKLPLEVCAHPSEAIAPA